jgi:hypothetical protein
MLRLEDSFERQIQQSGGKLVFLPLQNGENALDRSHVSEHGRQPGAESAQVPETLAADRVPRLIKPGLFIVHVNNCLEAQVALYALISSR